MGKVTSYIPLSSMKDDQVVFGGYFKSRRLVIDGNNIMSSNPFVINTIIGHDFVTLSDWNAESISFYISDYRVIRDIMKELSIDYLVGIELSEDEVPVDSCCPLTNIVKEDSVDDSDMDDDLVFVEPIIKEDNFKCDELDIDNIDEDDEDRALCSNISFEQLKSLRRMIHKLKSRRVSSDDMKFVSSD